MEQRIPCIEGMPDLGVELEHTSIDENNPILGLRSIGYNECPATLPHVQSGVCLREGRIPLFHREVMSESDVDKGGNSICIQYVPSYWFPQRDLAGVSTFSTRLFRRFTL